jgi:membrane protein DedA with SNARE-associated domain
MTVPPAFSEFSWLIERFPYVGIFALLILGSVGLPLPEDVILLFSGFLIARNVMAPVPAAVSAYAGVVASDFIIFWVGRKYGRSIVTHKRFHRLLSPEKFAVLEKKFNKLGSLLIFLGRYLWGIRAQIFLTAGVMGISPRKFVLADALAATLTVIIMLTLGKTGAKTIKDLNMHSFSTGQITAGVIIVLVALLIFILVRKRRYILSLFCALIAIHLAVVPVSAYDNSALTVGFDGLMGKSGIPTPWRLVVRAGQADAAVVSGSGAPVLHIRCKESSFSLERELMVAPHDYPYISWTWKATRLPVSGDVRKRGHNDQALQLLVAFENKKVLSYIWDSNAPEGVSVDESIGWPFNIGIKVIVVNSGMAEAGSWVTHTRNIYADYKKYFEDTPARIKGIRIQANTQYTGDFAEGFVGDIVFSKSLRDVEL